MREPKEYRAAPFKEQDRLDEGLLKTTVGDYLVIPDFSTLASSLGGQVYWNPFSSILEQDKLKEGLIRINPIMSGTEEYIPIDKLSQIQSKEKCFIATAIFGPSADETNVLRAWRDESLKTTSIGRLAVQAYYAISPKVVRLLERYPRLRGPIKSGLDYFVGYLNTR